MRCRLTRTRGRKHVAAALTLLDALGAADVNVVQNRTIQVSWRAWPTSGGLGRMMVTLSMSPTSDEASAKLACCAIRRCYRRHGLAVTA